MNRVKGISTAGDGDSGPKDGATPSGRSDVVERQRTLAELRCAARVLAPILGSHEQEELVRVARVLDERLRALVDPRRVGSAAPCESREAPRGALEIRGDVAWVDRELRGYAEILRVGLDRAPLPLRRSLLTQIGRASRAAAMTLLDLLIEEEQRLPERVAIVVDLATLLATEEKGGCRRVVRDPVALTAKLRSLAERSGANARIDLERAEQVLFEIAQRAARDGVEGVARELDARKAEFGVAMLAPSVLRAIVFCQSTVWRPALEEGGTRPLPPPEKGTASSAPVAREVQASRQVPTPPRRGGSLQQATAAPGTGASNASKFHWATSPATTSEAVPVRRPQPSRSQSQTRTRRIAGWVGVAASVCMAAYFWWGAESGNVRVFSDRELAAVSPEIASGYRSGSGTGLLFVGTVRQDWAERTHKERGQAARQMIERLSSSGVREVLLLDEARRVAVHHADGIPLRIGPETKAAG